MPRTRRPLHGQARRARQHPQRQERSSFLAIRIPRNPNAPAAGIARRRFRGVDHCRRRLGDVGGDRHDQRLPGCRLLLRPHGDGRRDGHGWLRRGCAGLRAGHARRVPILGIWHSGGARLAEGVLSLHGVGRIFHAMTQASGQDPTDLHRAGICRRRCGVRTGADRLW